MEFTTIDRILAKVHRDLGDGYVNETDAIERIGEALELLQVHGVQEQAFAHLLVGGHKAPVPKGLHTVEGIWRYVGPERDCPAEVAGDASGGGDIPSESPCPCGEAKAPQLSDNGWDGLGSHRGWSDWVGSDAFDRDYARVSLARGPLKAQVCTGGEIPAGGCGDQYAMVGTMERQFLFSFREGRVAVAYLANALDPVTGYPLVPDDIHFTTAVAYYVKWKMAEEQAWQGREGFAHIARDSEMHWLRCARQAKNHAKMPKGEDMYRNLREQALAWPAFGAR